MLMLMPQMTLVTLVFNIILQLRFQHSKSHLASLLGKSALHWAAAVNNVEAVAVLLKNGANKDMQDNKVREEQIDAVYIIHSFIYSLRTDNLYI